MVPFISEAHAEDLDAVVNVIENSLEAWSPYIEIPWSMYGNESISTKWAERLQSSEHQTSMLSANQTPIGMVSWTDERNTADAGISDGTSAHLTSIFVKTESQKLGAGKTLLAYAEVEMIENGYSTARLFTPSEHSTAIAFYRKNGWELTGLVRDGNPVKSEMRKHFAWRN